MRNLSIPWQPWLKGESLDRAQFEPDNNEAAFVVSVAYDSHVAFIREVLGYSSVVGLPDSPQISRKLPARHPYYDWLFATGVTDVAHYGGPRKVGPMDYAFNRTRMTVKFQNLPFPVLPDGVGLERDRYLSRYDYENTTDAVSLERGAFHFLEADDMTETEVSFPGSFFLAPRANVTWKWYHVPRLWLFNNDFIPTKLNSVVGTVNNADFAGYGKYTLLFLSPNILPRFAPVEPFFLNPILNNENMPIEFDVMLNMVYDPKEHNRKPLPREHQVDPWRLVADKSGGYLYAESDFETIFERAT